MKKIIIKTKNLFSGKMFKFLVFPLIMLIMPATVYSSQMDQNLVDDVTAMITNAKKLAHTVFVLDTSESMNTFAFSDYINTCHDSLSNIDNAIALCTNAYNQCRNVEQNAMCDVDLGCEDINTKCVTLGDTKTTLQAFCADIYSRYAEPTPKTRIEGTPLVGNTDAKKYVGPWDPKRADYKLDLCFYNWTEDTGGQVLNDQTSGHWTNPDDGSGYTDRRDWDCMTDGVRQPQFRGGLWLNWKYSTSLDAIKIIMGDIHDFAYAPRQRGVRKCQWTNYFPQKIDPVLGKICYQEFLTNPVGATAGLQIASIAAQARNNWSKIVDDNSGAYYPDADCDANINGDIFTPEITTVLPGDLNSLFSSVAGCDVCYSFNSTAYTWTEVPCRQYAISTTETAKSTLLSGIKGEVDYSCCFNYECSDPKCRDDDLACRSDLPTCNLGYYSDFDQDQSHCCAMLSCVEEDTGGCPTGGTFIPGPGNDVLVEFESDIGMPALADPNEYKNVELMAKAKTLSFGAAPLNVEKVIISIFYGCNVAGEKPTNKIGEKTFNAPLVFPGENIFAGLVSFAGCEKTGYKVGGTMQVFHSKAAFSKASVTLDLEFLVNFTSGADADIKVLDGAKEYYSEYISQATGTASDLVNEYECKTTFYHKQSGVVNGGPGNCNINSAFPNPATRPTRCVEPDHTVIAKDQWGTAKKTACSWLCRDQEVYDDVWKCRAFFSQMDNPARGGSGLCTASCPGDNSATLETCCICINGSGYNNKNLENPERVKFSAAGANLNCSVSGYEEGITSEGKRTYTSAYMAEVIKGHIKEVGDASYRLNNAGYVSPYNAATNKWYSELTLLNRSNSFLKDSFTSIFETGKNDERSIACIYDLMDNFDGEDCDDCGTGCCSVSIGDSTDYCDYPNFWMKIPETDGGKLIMPAKTISGADLGDYQTLIKNLKGKGGSTLGETLYDVWRYLGGMKPVYDPNYPAGYISPFQGAPAECFINNAIVISGGQPQFDDNYKLESPAKKTTQATPADAPFVVPDGADLANPARPYVRSNWYLSSFLKAARWVHTKDFWHEDTFCRADNNVNIYGYEVGGSTGGHTCTTATDTSGPNVIDTIHTVAIGEWALAPLYNNPANTYLETSILEQAATSTGGIYFGLTARNATAADPNIKTFYDLTAMFNAFNTLGSPDDLASGRPHWTSSLFQAYDMEEKVRGKELYSPATIPVDNRISRFWFGNLKKYYYNEASEACSLEPDVSCMGWERQIIPGVDCFYETDNGADITDPKFKIIMAGGAAKKLEDKLNATAITCDPTIQSDTPCFTSGARNVLYDDGTDMLELKNANPVWFAGRFALASGAIDTTGKAVQLLDYIYGYDAFDYDADGARNQVRFHNTGTISVDFPFDIDFTGATKIQIRPLLLGAITHSKPIAVYYEDTYTTRIFAGANDGMLHSFAGEDNATTGVSAGEETFAYIPKQALSAITAMFDGREGIFFNASVDGMITLFHIDQSNDGIINTGETAYLIFGYRRGATGYTVIDISELDKPKFVQHIPTEGLSFGKSTVFRKCGTAPCKYANQLTYYLAVPGGYDTCQDDDVPVLCPKTAGQIDPAGNEVYIYKFSTVTAKFELAKEYKMSSLDANADHLEWLHSSFTAAPYAINTSASLAKDTEFVYFTDLSSTVFRVDVRDLDPVNWKFRTVFRQRADHQNIVWTTGVRVYNSTTMYPPWEKYPSEDTQQSVPIPVMTGNLANMKISEMDETIAFYDNAFLDHALDPTLDSNNLYDIATDTAGNGSSPWAGFDGWKNPLIHSGDLDPLAEKNVVDGLIRYDKTGDFGHWHYANTFIPQGNIDCKEWGRTRNYRKLLIDGKEVAAVFDDVGCGFGRISKPTAPSILVGEASDQGTAATFSAGHDIFIEEEWRKAPSNVTNIIKWYELY